VIVPDSAHGTNPASATIAGMEVVPVASDARGGVDLAALGSLADGQTAAIMLTVPSTLGLLDQNLCEITEIVHKVGGLVYCDGANLNALLGRARLGDLGCDLLQLNVHKTFSTPHGGGGPGAGPVAVKAHLSPFLPTPLVVQRGEGFTLDYDHPRSIGRVRSFYGNFLVLVKAYAYIRALGAEGLRQVSGDAVLNANYLLNLVREAYDLPYEHSCMHEFVLSGRRQKAKGVRTLDIAKRLMDFGFHPPTVYFPLVVDEALMVEPTETESKEQLEAFAEALLQIAAEAEQEPEKVRGAPHSTRFGRMDEVGAARRRRLRWRPELATE
jgi:glycine dehydrogenase subunit 2